MKVISIYLRWTLVAATFFLSVMPALSQEATYISDREYTISISRDDMGNAVLSVTDAKTKRQAYRFSDALIPVSAFSINENVKAIFTYWATGSGFRYKVIREEAPGVFADFVDETSKMIPDIITSQKADVAFIVSSQGESGVESVISILCQNSVTYTMNAKYDERLRVAENALGERCK